MPKYIGLSVSFCIKDLALGLLDPNDVLVISGHTNLDLTDEEAVQSVIDRYNQVFWKDLPNAADIFRQFIKDGKIEQLKRRGIEPMHITHGHWIVRFESKRCK